MLKPSSHKFFPWRIFYRAAIFQATLVVVALLISGVAARYFFKRHFIGQVESQLHDSLLLISQQISSAVGLNACNQYVTAGGLRVSVMRLDGQVICDSELINLSHENYASQPEVQAATAEGFGQSVRYSDSTREEMFYGALALKDKGIIIRGALPLSRLSAAMRVFDTSLFLFLAAVAVMLSLIAVWSARSLVFPLGRLLVKTRSLISHRPEEISHHDLNTEAFGEWSDLESHIDRIRKNLESTTQSLAMEQIELDTVMAAISDAILAVDPEGIPLFFNSRFEVLFGGKSLRSRQKKLWEIFRDPEILGPFKVAWKEGRTSATKAILIEQEGGLKRYFSLAVSPLREHDQRIYGALGIFHDVTELKRAEQMRIDFVANVSHELRTPLTAIKGYAETLKEDLKPDEKVPKTAGDFLTIISKNCNRLMNIMEDLLDLSSLESTLILQKDSLDTAEVSARILKQLEPSFTSKRQSVKMENQAPTVFADANRLEQVVTNLLDNAHKYTPPEGQIKVRWEVQGNDVLLKIVDSGPGIPVEHQSRLFERFYRVDKARSREQGGTGLGLAIVKHIMQRHEGNVWVESAPGRGSTFICQFPS